jgi:hypothetical protein
MRDITIPQLSSSMNSRDRGNILEDANDISSPSRLLAAIYGFDLNHLQRAWNDMNEHVFPAFIFSPRTRTVNAPKDKRLV